MKLLKTLLCSFVVALTMCCHEGKKHNTTMPNKMPQTGFAPVNGIKMYYEIHGEGEPIVLIHGGGSTIETTFGKALPVLSENFQVIAVELQAHGRTSDRDTPESFEQDADDVAALLAFLKIPKASFFGFSNGGNTCMQICLRHPGITNKLIIASAFFRRDGMFPGFFDGLKNATLKNMPQELHEDFLKVNNDTAALRNMFEKDRNRMVNFKDWPDKYLTSINAPTLIIAGDKDVMSPEHTVLMSRKIPNSELFILPANHGSYMGEGLSRLSPGKMPDLTLAVIIEFLKKDAGAR